MELEKIRKITGIIHLQSGLHIGAGKDAVEIGGLDNPIIKNPLNNQPYIPGSSLKGKMRSLLEALLMAERPETRKFIEAGKPCQCGRRDCPICLIFGVSGSANKDSDIGPTRVLVRDSPLEEKCAELFKGGELPMEIKYENAINRLNGVANPRPLERVPAGVEFSLNIAFRVYNGDPPNLMDWLLKAMKLVELDALGGGGSRGCGEIRFMNIYIDGKLAHDTLDEINALAGGKAQ